MIPGLTDNRKGMLKFLGVVLIASVLDQTTFIFERSNTTAFEKYFESGHDDYEPEQARLWWFFMQLVSSLLSIWIITKIQPAFYYGIVAILFAIAQFVLAFVPKDSLEGYNPIIGICGGLASGSVLVVPIYLLWRHFNKEVKGVVLAAYFLCSGFLSNVVIYFILRSIWWGSSTFSNTEKEVKA